MSTTGRLRHSGSRMLGHAGNLAAEASRRLASEGRPSLQGDRWVEWSFCLARLAEGPGSSLDFGADIGFLSLAAAQRGHQVVSLDRVPVSPDFGHEQVKFLHADILDRPLEGRTFDQIINCSSVEHVGLGGRYGSSADPDGDLEAMSILSDSLAPNGKMIMTIPVGRDLVCAPLHRIYGKERMPRLVANYSIEEQQFWHKESPAAPWTRTDRNSAQKTEGSPSFYSLGLFVLGKS